MTDGVFVEIADLIALQQGVYSPKYPLSVASSRIGQHLSKRRGRGMGFAEARNYMAGDEIRHMEWRMTARTGKPHVKVYQEERERPVVLLTDFNPSMFFGTRVALKSVVAAKLSALIAWTAIRQKDRVGGLLFSAQQHHEFLPRARDAGVLPMLAQLCRYTQSAHDFLQPHLSPTHLSQMLIRLRRVAKPGSILVLISDFYHFDEESEQHLQRLGEHNDILAYVIHDQLERYAPTSGEYALTNGQQELLYDFSNQSQQQVYQKEREKRLSKVCARLQRLRVQAIEVNALMDLPQLVRQTFPRRQSV